MIHFGKTLKIVQEMQGVKSSELARRLSVSRSQLSRWRSQPQASLGLVEKLCEALEYDPLEFIKVGRNDLQ
jgi:transcriptional regulator with XRE-family HTH domain